MYNYGNCHVCGGKMQTKQIKQDFWIKNKLVVIEDVPAGVCSQCGEKVVNADVGRRLAGALKDTARRKKARTIAVPVIRLAKDVA
jgi:YgiT-type zinc finger domain-containing protein